VVRGLRWWRVSHGLTEALGLTSDDRTDEVIAAETDAQAVSVLVVPARGGSPGAVIPQVLGGEWRVAVACRLRYQPICNFGRATNQIDGLKREAPEGGIIGLLRNSPTCARLVSPSIGPPPNGFFSLSSLTPFGRHLVRENVHNGKYVPEVHVGF